MAKEFTSRNQPGQAWAYKLVSGNATFQSRAVEFMDSIDDCLFRRYKNVTATERWSKCTENPNKPMLRSMYDQQINMWRDVYSDDSFCIIDYEFLHSHPAQALDTATRFIGLPRAAWPSKLISVHDYFNSTMAALPIDEKLHQRMSDFFAHHGTVYYDQAKISGYWGCKPDAEAAAAGE